MRLVGFFAGLVLVGLLASCATLNKAQCEAGDWRAIGMNDGANGLPLSSIDNHVTACAKHGIAVSRELYAAGRNEGLRSYCQLERAESDARAGRMQYNSCQGEIGVAFNRVYHAAQNVRDVEQRLATANGRMETLLTQTVSPDLTVEQRANLRTQISTLQGTLRILEDERRQAESTLRNARLEEEKRLANMRG